VVLHPLPLVPIMVCYWLAEEGMQSSLNVFFDDTANESLDIGDEDRFCCSLFH
jgi:dipeptide/tripeptide permease